MAGFVTAHAHDRAEGSTTAAFCRRVAVSVHHVRGTDVLYQAGERRRRVRSADVTSIRTFTDVSNAGSGASQSRCCTRSGVSVRDPLRQALSALTHAANQTCAVKEAVRD